MQRCSYFYKVSVTFLAETERPTTMSILPCGESKLFD